LLSLLRHCQQYTFIKSVATETQEFVLFSAAERLYVAGSNKTYLKVPIIFPDFHQIWIFSADFYREPPTPNGMEIRTLGAALIHADRWADGWTD
jgi:hypothetical protein